MMNRLLTLLLAASCLTAVGQVTYPYNPDGNADGDIAVGDLQDFLVTYGNPFSPSEIMVGDSSLIYWVEQLSQTVQEQQEVIDSLVSISSDEFYEVNWVAGDTVYAPSLANHIFVNVDSTWYHGPFWQVRGWDSLNDWHEIENVSFSELASTSLQLEIVHSIYIDYMPYCTLLLDSCRSNEVSISYNRTTDFQTLIPELEALIINVLPNLYENFDLDMERAPQLQIGESGFFLGERQHYYRPAVYRELYQSWSVGAGLLGGASAKSNSYLKLPTGQWVPVE